MKRVLTLAEMQVEGVAAIDHDPESPQDQSHALVQSKEASTVPIASTQGEPSTAAKVLNNE